jgi:pimeloyl-ACP methyl ester carboxylesterase
VIAPDLPVLECVGYGLVADMLKVATANGVTETTMKAVNDGMIASGAALSFADLPTTAVRFKIPYYVIQGRDDLVAPTPLVEAYFNKLSAPKKRLFVINGAGHFALATDQAEVIGAETDPSLNTQNEAKVELKAFTIRHPWLTAMLTFTTGG